jgi:3-deoxy-manno-octulosonate cytidylyltransferase (CMP-KDO synthetase)
MNATGTEYVLAVIPARYGSTRLPGKPLKDIGGLPMIAHVIDRVRHARLVNEVMVATDDRRIAEAAEAAGATAVMTSSELQSGTDRIAAAVRDRSDATIVVNVQGDEPLLPAAMVDQTVNQFLKSDWAHAGTLVKRISSGTDLRNPSIPKVVLGINGECLYFSRSTIPYLRDVPETDWLAKGAYWKHIGLYVFRRDFLFQYASLPQTPLELSEKLEQLRILEHGFRMVAAVTELDSIAVDTEEDLARVRAIVEGKPQEPAD